MNNIPYTHAQVRDLPKGINVTRTFLGKIPDIEGNLVEVYSPNRRERRRKSPKPRRIQKIIQRAKDPGDHKILKVLEFETKKGIKTEYIILKEIRHYHPKLSKGVFLEGKGKIG